MSRFFFACICVLCCATQVFASEMTARDYFRVLPNTIFENTPEGLPEYEKRQLLEVGRTDFWELRSENPDSLHLTSVPFGESGVSIRVFRDGTSEEAGHKSQWDIIALGTEGPEVCTLELWRADTEGRIVPVDTPPAPSPTEYFSADKPMPKNANISMLFCLEKSGLEVVPLFWNEEGMIKLPVQYRVHYVWEGGKFVKKNVRIPAAQ